jgi:UDP-N-acetylglucosamine 2-epimerase (non-hydrolysing)
VPCLTVRLNTERPVTVTEGTNELVGVDPERIVAAGLAALAGGGKKGRIPELWDGKAAERIAKVLDRIAQRG